MSEIRFQSIAMHKALSKVIPGGVNSPVRSCKAVGVCPLIAVKGSGALLYDLDGNEYIDYCGSWGALMHGHAHPDVIQVIKDTAERGTSFGISTPLEEQLAAAVIKLMPSIQKIRFVSTGTEATMSAVRLARGFTGRDLIVKFDGHYHGHADFFLIQAGSGALDLEGTPASQGIPKEFVKNTICLPFNDLEALQQLFAHEEIRERLAAVILEPIAGNMGVVPADKAWMHVLRDLTAKNGTLLIFDEVMTGFRVAKGGAQSLYGIVPDLTCLGKIVGGGLPAAAFGGRAEIMDRLAPLGPVYQAGTLSGNPLAMAAGIKALELLDAPGFYEELEKKTKRLVDPIQKLIAQESLPYCIQSVGSMLTLFVGASQVTNAQEARGLDAEGFSHLFQKLLNLGIYIPPLQQEAWFVSMAHTGEQLDRTAECVIEILSSVCYAGR